MRLRVALLFLVYTEGKKKPEESDDDFAPNVDVYPAPFPSPVPFGHIFKDGIGDLSPDQKQPADLLEIDMLTPPRHEQENYIRAAPKTNILKIVEEPLGYANPRDEYQRFNILNAKENAEKGVTALPNVTDDRPLWFNFEAIHEHNIKTPRPAVALQVKKPANVDIKSEGVPEAEPKPESGKTNYFSSNSYNLLKNPETRVVYDHWTTCDQFEKKTKTFQPKDIVDIDWVPFYVWTTKKFVVSIVHRFSFPTKKIVKEYKQSYGPYLNVTVDWERPKLLLKEEIEMLLIAVDGNGLFHAIPRIKMPFNMQYSKDLRLPVTTIRIKIEDPYLALMYCEEYYATIMAAPGAEPSTDEEKTEEAAILHFKGEGFPVARDLELEELRKKGEIERQREYEETRYIKVLETGFDIERE